MQSWNVYLGNKWVDTVFFSKDCDAEYVRDSLVNHDGMNPSIEVVKGI